MRSKMPGIVAPTLNVGLIKGGINTNVVPDQVAFRIDRRIVPEEDPVAVEAALRALIADCAKCFPQATVTIRTLLLAQPLVPQPGTDRVATALQRHAERILGIDVPTAAVPLYTDAPHHAPAPIPPLLSP